MSNTSEKWYKEGLKFSCTQCGNCCTGDPGVVWVDDEEIANIAELLGQSIGEVKLNYTRLYGKRLSLKEYANGDCVFFDGKTRGCKIYSARPKQCRTWPFWNSIIESPESWQATGTDCPGLGCGKLYSLEEVEEQAGVIDI